MSLLKHNIIILVFVFSLISYAKGESFTSLDSLININKQDSSVIPSDTINASLDKKHEKLINIWQQNIQQWDSVLIETLDTRRNIIDSEETILEKESELIIAIENNFNAHNDSISTLNAQSASIDDIEQYNDWLSVQQEQIRKLANVNKVLKRTWLKEEVDVVDNEPEIVAYKDTLKSSSDSLLVEEPVPFSQPIIVEDNISLNDEQNDTDSRIVITKDSIINEAKNEVDDQFLEAIYTQDTLSLRDLVSGFDKESLKKTWETYLSLKQGSSDVAEVSSKIDIVAEKEQETPKSADEFVSMYVDQEEKYQDTIIDSGIIFVVQIAASRDSLSDSYINSLYSGNKTIHIRAEEDWYKYQMGHTAIYSEAKSTMNEINVPGAFIVPYLEGKKLTLWEVLLEQRKKKENKIVEQSNALEKEHGEVVTKNIPIDVVLFVVQVVASREPVDSTELSSINKGDHKLRMIVEDNWYKYQIVAGSSYDEVIEVWKECGVKDSFVGAYLNGKKISMTEAIKLNKQKQ